MNQYRLAQCIYQVLNMSAKSLMIQEVESQYTQTYIANVFWRQDIAKVSNITLIPYIKNSEIYNIAYINIAEWCDTEAAFNFIQRLTNPEREARIVYSEDNWWPVEINTHNNGNISVGTYTVVFDLDYFENNKCDDSTAPCTEVDDEEYICDEEEWEEFVEKRPIKGLGNDYYTFEEAIEHLYLLNEDYDSAPSQLRQAEIEKEILHFENELQIHDSVNKSSNVTQRALSRHQEFEHESFPLWFGGETPKREIAGEWCNDIDLSVLDTLFNNPRREIALNNDEMFA